MLPLTQLEEHLIHLIINPTIKDYDILKLQLPFLKVKERQFTRVGAYINFFSSNEKIIDNSLNIILSSPHLLKLDTVSNLISFELDVTQGTINFLELVINGNELWNGDYDKYEIIDF